MKHEVYLSLGSNLGNERQTIKMALRKLSDRGIAIVQQSSYYKSQGWGNAQLNDFLNIAVKAEVNYSPQELLKEIQAVEEDLGRVRKKAEPRKAYEDRIIDIDIIFFNDLLLRESDLEIPHLHFQDRNFVLYPLFEIAPDYQDPRSGKSIAQLLELSKDANFVDKLS